jgi:hypothetical protein
MNNNQDNLTKREHIAAMALQGMLANINQSYGKPNVGDIHIQEALRLQQQFINDVATKAVQYSDALIKALKEEGGTMSKQSSIDWLEKQLYSGRELSTIIQQAKAMHKEESELIFECGRNFQLTGEGTFNVVYNETFGG